MKSPCWTMLIACSLALLCPTRAVRAQGVTGYMNVESPQVRPLALATVGSQRVLLVCNTPDNSVEVWSTASTPVFLHRLPVGLEPVSLTVSGDRFWTANFLGDSVSAGQLVVASGNLVRAKLLKTVSVGDEPMDVAFHATSGTPAGTIFVTLQTSSRLAWRRADTLEPHQPALVLELGTAGPDGRKHGLNEPRRVVVRGDRVYVLAFKGGVTHASSRHDLDVVSWQISTLLNPASAVAIATLGSTNFSADFDSSGSLWVAGGEAKNFDNETKNEVRDEPGGFVTSMLYRVQNPDTTPVIHRRNVNATAAGAIVGKAAATAMPTDLAFVYHSNGQVKKVFFTALGSDRVGILAQDVLPQPPAVTDIQSWSRRKIDYPGSTAGGNPRWGPRGMALGTNQAGQQRLFVMNRLDNSVSVFDPIGETHLTSFPLSRDPTPAYVRNGRPFLYDASLSGTGFVSCASCHTDGRTDALSWKLGNPGVTGVEPAPTALSLFALGDVGVISANDDPLFYLSTFIDPGPPTTTLRSPPAFDPDVPNDKREMITQSLQGLSNFEVSFNPAIDPGQAFLVRSIFHNAPFHWRGDKPSLRDFNEAFVTLLGGDDDQGSVGDVRALSNAEMTAFERFVHSIVLPPNPKQPPTREYSTIGLQLFHEGVLSGPEGNRSCVHCHSLPDGSNNRLTIFQMNDVADFPPGYITASNRQPIESAQLRGLLQKQPLIEANGSSASGAATVIGHFGLAHNGVSPLSDAVTNSSPYTSINTFIEVFEQFTDGQREALKQYVHEFDWGVAPIIGSVRHYTEPALGGVPDAAWFSAVRVMEDQGLIANAGVVIWLLRSTATALPRGFFLAAEASTIGPGGVVYPYFEEITNSPPVLIGNIGAVETLLQPGDSLVVMAVPLGSERRIASPSGKAEVFAQTTPSDIILLPMVPNTANAPVPSFRNNWIPDTAPSLVINGAAPLDFTGPPDPDAVDSPDNMVDMPFAKTIRLFQYGLLDRPLPSPSIGTYGVSDLRHEAPRRFRVGGAGIQKGAKLLLSVPFPPLGYSGPPPSDPAAQPTFPVLTLELPLYATRHASGVARFWETAVEVDPFWAYALMLGGPRAPGVQRAIDSPISWEYNLGNLSLPPLPNPVEVLEPTLMTPTFQSPFDPDHWNWFKVQVRNPGPNGVEDASGPASAITFQQLTMNE
jgi:hypothetical protein